MFGAMIPLDHRSNIVAKNGAKGFGRASPRREPKNVNDQLLDAALKAYQAGRFAEAQFICGKILTFQPKHFSALTLLGVTQLDTGAKEAAEQTMKRALAIEPGSAAAHYNHGLALFKLQRFDEARSAYERAVEIKPHYSLALNNLGNLWQHLGDIKKALPFYEKSVKIEPHNADAWSNCGGAHLLLEQFDEAARCLTEALRLNPRLVKAICHMCQIDFHHRHYTTARSRVEAALQLGADRPLALISRGWLRMHLGELAAAYEDCEAAVALAPTMKLALVLCADAAMLTGHSARAAELAEQALRMSPDDPWALSVLADCKAAWGDAEGAVLGYNKAIAASPNYEPAITQKIFALDFILEADFAMQQSARRQWWDNIGSHLQRCVLGPIDRDPDRQLRIGYVSSDFRVHSAGIPLVPVFRAHDRSRFQITAYSCSPIQDEVTDKFRELVDIWVDAAELSDQQLTAKILSDQIDILVDMSGHTAGNRLRVFARKPAPIQVSAWGSGGGTGIPLIDYLLNDRVSIPDHARPLHAEKIADLPCQITMEPITLPISDLPMNRNGYVTFGVFNRIDKISEAAAALWSRILAALPTARLVIKHGSLDQAEIRARLIERLAASGIASERVTLLGPSIRLNHLLAFGEIDISLDPFPLNGGASTWESLYMGVPVVTKLGKTQSSRAAGSIMTAVGLPEFVAANEDEYVATALHWATHTGELAALRRDLRARISNSDAGDPVRYCRHLEALYRRFWVEFCASPPSEKNGNTH